MAETDAKRAQWQKLFDYLLGNQAAWIIDVGLKAELFRTIATAGPGGIREDTLAERLDYQPRYVRVWCRAAYAFELVDWDQESGYRLAPHMEALLLDATDPQFMGGRLQFYTALYEDYRAFPDSLRTGRVWPRNEHDPWLLEALKNLTKPDAVVVTEHVLPQAPEALAGLETGGTVLEIGPGGGYALAHLAKRFPRSRIVGIEFDPSSIELARRTLEDAGVDDRVEIRHGDANELADEDVYDLVVMNIVLHETGGPAEYRNVLRRTRRALKPGGTVIVSELPYPDSPAEYRAHPVYKALAGVQIHEAQVGCGAITQGELRALLEEAGFANPRVADQPLPTRFIMLAEK
ncbi:MAG: methyltransferase domain-containing protein [Chloroflexia bacterium]|nr:methyltransferase domain-containing protein [Chloroflexia bacterium]